MTIEKEKTENKVIFIDLNNQINSGLINTIFQSDYSNCDVIMYFDYQTKKIELCKIIEYEGKYYYDNEISRQERYQFSFESLIPTNLLKPKYNTINLIQLPIEISKQLKSEQQVILEDILDEIDNEFYHDNLDLSDQLSATVETFMEHGKQQPAFFIVKTPNGFQARSGKISEYYIYSDNDCNNHIAIDISNLRLNDSHYMLGSEKQHLDFTDIIKRNPNSNIYICNDYRFQPEKLGYQFEDVQLLYGKDKVLEGFDPKSKSTTPNQYLYRINKDGGLVEENRPYEKINDSKIMFSDGTAYSGEVKEIIPGSFSLLLKEKIFKINNKQEMDNYLFEQINNQNETYLVYDFELGYTENQALVKPENLETIYKKKQEKQR